MDDKLLSDILEQLKIQTQMAQDSIARSEAIRQETKEKLESSNRILEKQQKDAGTWKYYLLGFFAVLIGITVIPKYLNRQQAKEFESKMAIDAAKADSIRSTYAVNMRFIQSEFENGQYDDLIQKKGAIINRYPSNPEAYYIIGASYFNIGSITDAEPFFKISDSLLPDPKNIKYLNAIQSRKQNNQLKNM